MPDLDLPNLRHLHGFCAVVAAGSISAATGLARLSQPALTQAIAKLETRIGARLFERLPGGMILTPPGARLVLRVDRGFKLLEQGAQAIGTKPHLARMLSLAQLRAFLAMEEHGNFRAAAAVIGCEVSTVTRSCRELETQLAVPLFERSAAVSRVTPQALVLARAIRLALAEFNEGFFEVASWRGAVVGKLGIGCLPLAQATLLPAALARFTQEFPRIEIRVIDGYYAGLSRSLLQAGIDLIVGALRQADLPQGLVQEVLFDDPLALIARHDHPLTRLSAPTLADLASLGWVAPRIGAPSRAYFDRLIASLGPSDRPAPIETGAHNVIRGILMETDRVAMISLAQMRGEIAAHQLARISIALPDSARPIGITLRDNWEPSLPKQRFLAILRAIAAGK